MANLSTDLNRPLALHGWFDEPVGLLAPAHREVLRRAIAQERTATDVLQELSIQTMFDFGALNWFDILKLRRSNHIGDFRLALKRMESLPAGSVQEAWRSEVEKLAESGRRSPAQALLGGFLGNLPLGDLSPIGVAHSVSDFFREDERSRRFGWLYFVMDARSKLGKSGSRSA